MRRLCLIPAKPIGRAKARLSPMLPPDARRSLTFAMLRDVIEAARVCGDVWVVCSDPEVAAIARSSGVTPFPDPTPDAGLNRSLEAATSAARDAGFDGVLVLSSDLPCVTEDDIEAIPAVPGVAIAPSRDGGTNALWRMPADIIPTAFGPGSRDAHERLAIEAGIRPLIVDRIGLALDVDDPEDLADALSAGAGIATVAAMAALDRQAASHKGAGERYRSRRR